MQSSSGIRASAFFTRARLAATRGLPVKETAATHIRPAITIAEVKTTQTSALVDSYGRKDNFSRTSPLYRRTMDHNQGLPVSSATGAAVARAYSTAAALEAVEPVVHHMFESQTGTWQYVVADPATSKAVIIDPVLDFDAATQNLITESADSLLALVLDHSYKIEYILETHAHADHLTAASYIQSRLARTQGHKPPVGIGKRIGSVQHVFAKKYGVPAEEFEGVFERLFEDDETFEVGNLKGQAVHLPGHTPDHMGYVFGDNVFCGDTLFNADIGTARCDFPGGDARALYKTGRKILDMPENVKVWTGHDYPPKSRGPLPYMTVGEHKKNNKHMKDGTTEEEFVTMRTERDAALPPPRLIHPSLQMNIRSGKVPKKLMLSLPVHLESDKMW